MLFGASRAESRVFTFSAAVVLSHASADEVNALCAVTLSLPLRASCTYTEVGVRQPGLALSLDTRHTQSSNIPARRILCPTQFMRSQSEADRAGCFLHTAE